MCHCCQEWHDTCELRQPVNLMINYSKASENNKAPLLEQLRRLFAEPGNVLEVGAGSGQHALHFADALGHLVWQPTDQGAYFDGLVANLRAAPLENVLAPRFLDIESSWPGGRYRYGFAANVLHIAPARMIAPFMTGFADHIEPGGLLCVYGPFKYGGEFTTPSNERFDEWLKRNNAESGIRDIEVVLELADARGLTLDQDIAMPANNQLLVFGRR